ncbi:MAG: hypothetical protein Q8S55_11355 [Methylococcaceae bacterium]|nr:hypothetical protein [Methylococcaceae bacterium]
MTDIAIRARKALIKSFDKLRMNGNLLISFVVSLSNHERNRFVQRFLSNLSKCHHIYDNSRDRLKQFVVPRLLRLTRQNPKQYFREFWALKDVSFEIKNAKKN